MGGSAPCLGPREAAACAADETKTKSSHNYPSHPANQPEHHAPTS